LLPSFIVKRTALMLRSAMAGWAKGKSGMGLLRVDASASS
jgi:hypothetical protein